MSSLSTVQSWSRHCDDHHGVVFSTCEISVGTTACYEGGGVWGGRSSVGSNGIRRKRKGRRSRTYGEQQPIDTPTPEYLRRHVLEHRSAGLGPAELYLTAKPLKRVITGRMTRCHSHPYIGPWIQTWAGLANQQTRMGGRRAFTFVRRTLQRKVSAMHVKNCPPMRSWKMAVWMRLG